jgi:hypothetical protein
LAVGGKYDFRESPSFSAVFVRNEQAAGGTFAPVEFVDALERDDVLDTLDEFVTAPTIEPLPVSVMLIVRVTFIVFV